MVNNHRHFGQIAISQFSRLTWTFRKQNVIFLAQVIFGIEVIILVFRALDWLSSISGAKIMAQNPKIGKNSTPTNADHGYIIPILWQ